MFPEERKYFRFRFSRVLALAFLLISPTQFTHVQATGMPASCGVAAKALSDPTGPKFVNNLVDCLIEMTKVKNWEEAGELIQKLPELMEKALPIAKKGGLVVLSGYFLYSSYKLHDRAMNLDRDYNMHRHEFEALEEEMKPVRDLMETQLIPQWEKGNYANTQKSAEKVLQMLSRSSKVLAQLVQAIHKNATKVAGDKSWSVFCGVGAIVVCAGSVVVGNTPFSFPDPPFVSDVGPRGLGWYIPAMMLTCGGSVVTAAFCGVCYYSLDETLTKLDVLWEDTTKMHKEIVKYRAQLDIAKMRGEFEI